MTLDLEVKKIKGHFFSCFTSRKGRIFIVHAEIVWYIESKERDKKLGNAVFAAMEDRQIQENLRKIHNEIANVPGDRGAVKIVEAYGENNDN